MQKHVITGILGLLIGLTVGFVGANKINRSSPSAASENVSTAAVAGTSSPGPAPVQGGMQPDIAAMIERSTLR